MHPIFTNKDTYQSPAAPHHPRCLHHTPWLGTGSGRRWDGEMPCPTLGAIWLWCHLCYFDLSCLDFSVFLHLQFYSSHLIWKNFSHRGKAVLSEYPTPTLGPRLHFHFFVGLAALPLNQVWSKVKPSVWKAWDLCLGFPFPLLTWVSQRASQSPWGVLLALPTAILLEAEKFCHRLCSTFSSSKVEKSHFRHSQQVSRPSQLST